MTHIICLLFNSSVNKSINSLYPVPDMTTFNTVYVDSNLNFIIV